MHALNLIRPNPYPLPRVVLTLTNQRTEESESFTVNAEDVTTHVRAFATRHKLSTSDISISTLEI